MKLSVKGLTLAAGIFWALTFFFVAFFNLLSSSYGNSFLDVMHSVYPGYKTSGGFGGVIVGTLYALVDGAVAGAVFAWIYNRIAD